MSGSSRESGQALVEAALTLPLTVFLILGSIQLFMMMQGRIMAHYAAARATRAGSVDHADCRSMRDAAVAALLPTFARTDTPERLGAAFAARRFGRYDPTRDGGRDEDIFWLIRERPTAADIDRDAEEVFDLLEPAIQADRILEVRLVFWFPLRIPLADWVIARIALASAGVQNLQGANPLMLTQREPDWMGTGTLRANVADELSARTDREHYVIPIETTYAMRMMTPARAPLLTPRRCPMGDAIP